MTAFQKKLSSGSQSVRMVAASWVGILSVVGLGRQFLRAEASVGSRNMGNLIKNYSSL